MHILDETQKEIPLPLYIMFSSDYENSKNEKYYKYMDGKVLCAIYNVTLENQRYNNLKL